jgi:hypothetical protein
MSDAEAIKEDWRRLFEAAIKFKQQGCWEWMSDEDYFVMTDPETGDIGCCVVLGAGGMDYGLNVYHGPEARSYLKKLTDSFTGSEDDEEDEELMFSMKAISVNFEDRGQLDNEDLSLIRDLGYTFRGSREWPQFRSYEPGLVPWGLNGRQVRFLTHALEQAFLVAERFRENDEMYFEHDEEDEGIGEKRLHRVPHHTEHGIAWRDEWLPWHGEPKVEEPYLYPDEIRIHQCKKNCKKSKEIWETDFNFVQVAFGDEGERPYYPRLCLWVKREDGTILTAHLVEKMDCREQYVEQLIQLLEAANRKPARIEAGSSEAFLALKNSAEKIGVPIRHNPLLVALLDAKMAVESSL